MTGIEPGTFRVPSGCSAAEYLPWPLWPWKASPIPVVSSSLLQLSLVPRSSLVCHPSTPLKTTDKSPRRSRRATERLKGEGGALFLHLWSQKWHPAFWAAHLCFGKCTVVPCSQCNFDLIMLTCLRFMCFDWCFPSQVDRKTFGPHAWNRGRKQATTTGNLKGFSCISSFKGSFFFVSASIRCAVWNVLLSIDLYRFRCKAFVRSGERTNLFLVGFVVWVF